MVLHFRNNERATTTAAEFVALGERILMAEKYDSKSLGLRAWSLGQGDSGAVMLGVAKQLPNHRRHVPFAEQNKTDREIEWASLRPAEVNFDSAGAIPAQFPCGRMEAK